MAEKLQVAESTWGLEVQTHRRLAAEQRIVGLLALLALAHLVWLLAWAALSFDGPTWMALTAAAIPIRIAIVALLACIGVVVHVALRMPAQRWRRTGPATPSPWPLALIGTPSLLVWPLLILRDRRARAKSALPAAELELAFRQLLDVPRIAGTVFAGWMTALTAIASLALAQAATTSTASLAAFVGLSLASLLPLVSLSISRIRQILVPELLGAPRPDPAAIPLRSSVRWRLGTPAGLALLGAVLVPALVAGLWAGGSLATALALAALGLTAGVIALALLLRDLERDLDRASNQVASVADGEIPEPMVVETFVTAELRGLVAAVDKLVGRITDANIHKYVLIEKGHEADRLKSQFLANMSHDLRSPLNSVIGFSDLLLTGIEGEMRPEQTEMVQIILDTGRRLLQQIDDILDTAKIEAGRMELHPEPTPPATLIARAIKEARSRAPENVEFDTTFAPGLPPVYIDPYRTTQALVNVLLFGAEGIEAGMVEITCQAIKKGDTRVISLRIVSPRAQVPVEQLNQARRGFFRLPGHSGLGLGLPIATAVVEQQGGKLLIQDGADYSQVGLGHMAFDLRLPALTARRAVRPRLR